MAPTRVLALCGGGIFLLSLGFVVLRGGSDMCDGEEAVLNVKNLRKGMNLQDAIATLHPTRVKGQQMMSYGLRPCSVGNPSGSYQMLHALTRDQSLDLTYEGVAGRTSNPKLVRWKLESGEPSREDVTFGRAFKMGRYQFHY